MKRNLTIMAALVVCLGVAAMAGDKFYSKNRNTGAIFKITEDMVITQTGTSGSTNALGPTSVTGAFSASGALSSSAGRLSGVGLTNSGTKIATPTTYTLGAGTETTPTSELGVVTSTGGALTLTATPTISTASTSVTAGQVFIVLGGTNTITFQDNDTLSDSCLELGATTRALDVGDVLALVYRSSKWYELYYRDSSAMSDEVGGDLTVGGAGIIGDAAADLHILSGHTTLKSSYTHVGDGGTVDAAEGDGDLYVEDELEVDGSPTLGDSSADLATINATALFETFDRSYNQTSAEVKVTTPTYIGLRVFDTTLNQPVWSSGTTTCFDWVTSTGTIPLGYE